LVNVQGDVTNSCDSWVRVWPKAVILDKDGNVVNEKHLYLANQTGPGSVWLAPNETKTVEILHILIPSDGEFGNVDLRVNYEFVDAPFGYGL
jgi:hypothetical protein